MKKRYLHVLLQMIFHTASLHIVQELGITLYGYGTVIWDGVLFCNFLSLVLIFVSVITVSRLWAKILDSIFGFQQGRNFPLYHHWLWGPPSSLPSAYFASLAPLPDWLWGPPSSLPSAYFASLAPLPDWLWGPPSFCPVHIAPLYHHCQAGCGALPVLCPVHTTPL